MGEKYRRITFKILLIIPLLASLFFADIFILPQKHIEDNIVSYSERTISSKGRFSSNRSKLISCYTFYTEKDYVFSTEKRFVDENEVIIEYSYIFKIVTSVKSKTEDYSNKLISGLSGLNLLLTICLLISTIISLLILRFKTNLSENLFYNIILLNSWLLFILLYFWSRQN